jgi:DNA-binding NtrC family response regulator
VLLVEDEPRLREMLLRALAEMGFRPTAAASAEAALKLLEQYGCGRPAGKGEANLDASPETKAEARLYGIVILDLNLPGMGGMDLLAALRERWPVVQVIILTGFGDLEAARQAIHLDVVDFLTKPCALGDLEIALDRARHRLRKEIDPAARAGSPPPSPTPAPAHPTNPRLEFVPRETRPAVSLEAVERETILAALEKHHGNRNAAAAELGISLRKLYYRLAQYQRQGRLPQ